jgi:hypothetical protein
VDSTLRRVLSRSLFGLLQIEDASVVLYLTPLVDLARLQGPMSIATLNYDRSVEEISDAHDYPCDTAIDTWLSSGALEWPVDGIRLLKLHGSIDWIIDESYGRGDGLPTMRIVTAAPEREVSYAERPAIVFGEVGKVRSEGPFLALLMAWAAALDDADVLLVVGYSFRDTHVNEIIAR